MNIGAKKATSALRPPAGESRGNNLVPNREEDYEWLTPFNTRPTLLLDFAIDKIIDGKQKRRVGKVKEH